MKKHLVLFLLTFIILFSPVFQVQAENILDSGLWTQNFTFTQNGVEFGLLEHQMGKMIPSDKDKGIYTISSELTFSNPASPSANDVILSITSVLTLDTGGRALSYKLGALAQGDPQYVRCTWTEEQILAEAKARGQEIEKTVQLQDGKPSFVLDNNLIGQWSLLSILQGWKDKREKWSIACFVPQTLGEQVFEIEWLGQSDLPQEKGVVCQRYMIHPVEEYMYINDEGFVVRIEDPRQNIVIKQSRLEKQSGDKVE
jgi:hypothetical protein